jgi:hypothetical protein
MTKTAELVRGTTRPITRLNTMQVRSHAEAATQENSPILAEMSASFVVGIAVERAALSSSLRRVPHSAASIMKQSKFPSGWNAERVRRVLDHYEDQTEDEAVAEDEAALPGNTLT